MREREREREGKNESVKLRSSRKEEKKLSRESGARSLCLQASTTKLLAHVTDSTLRPSNYGHRATAALIGECSVAGPKPRIPCAAAAAGRGGEGGFIAEPHSPPVP